RGARARAAPACRHAARQWPHGGRARRAQDGRRTAHRTRTRTTVAPAGERGGGGGVSTVTETRDIVGVSARRPDGIPKVKGAFAYSSDAWADRMLWGSTLRSPHPRAKIRSIE